MKDLLKELSWKKAIIIILLMSSFFWDLQQTIIAIQGKKPDPFIKLDFGK